MYYHLILGSMATQRFVAVSPKPNIGREDALKLTPKPTSSALPICDMIVTTRRPEGDEENNSRALVEDVQCELRKLQSVDKRLDG